MPKAELGTKVKRGIAKGGKFECVGRKRITTRVDHKSRAQKKETGLPEKQNNDEHKTLHLEGGGIVIEKPKSREDIDRETRDREQHEFAREQVKTNNRIRLFTLLLVIVTSVGTVIEIWQASIAQTAANASQSASKTASDTLREMQTGSGSTDTHILAQQAVTQAEQTTALANAAKSSADAAVSSSRAWIVPAQDNHETQLIPINLPWKNAGPTPAVGIEATAEYDFGVVPFKEKHTCDQLRTATQWKTKASFLLANATFVITLQGVPPQWESPIPAPQEAKFMFIHGCVWYTDVVASHERTTEFCYMATRTKLEAVYERRPDLRGHLQEAEIIPCLHTDPFIFK